MKIAGKSFDEPPVALRPGLQAWRADLLHTRAELQSDLQIVNRRIEAVESILGIDRDIQAPSEKREVAAADTRVRWQGATITEAVGNLLAEDPSMTRSRILDRLLDEGFDFKGKLPAQSVSMAYTHLTWGKKQGGSGSRIHEGGDGKPSPTQVLRRLIVEAPSFTNAEFRSRAAQAIPSCRPKSLTSALKRAREAGDIESLGRGRWKSLRYQGATLGGNGRQGVLPGAAQYHNAEDGGKAEQIAGPEALAPPVP